MDTAQEALFKAMLNNDWFTASDGHVDSPTGYFGYVTNTERDNLTATNGEFMSFFGETIGAYGWPKHDELIGSFVASINSDGIITIVEFPNDTLAREQFNKLQIAYESWNEEN
ncbi:hypothetical protein PBI_KAMPE_109 [Gordonia phage Kampe]|uniref:Uncharacterized protein n=3 Tax=Gordonia phage Orchid TaxID=1838075 RepID=A0A166YGR4_9CAUD|nr:hypothetical protein BH761_gp105 [Gordonia phage Orchid]ANA87341.1 hypothetical protein PBI_PATRICKSTAR_109 [Gordonia phage PatrickStar]ANA87452.1 hypothetical protein PBI_ORCHID_108 [Gordonia phage Orchid]ANA87567.1 hypothetical protein PBI_KAMPE_109 [Gordonia phage Kampe]